MSDKAAPMVKGPGSTLDYLCDWTRWLGSADEISASTWVVPADLTLVSDSFTAKTATAWLSGGILGEVYSVVNRIETVGGRKEERVLTFVMATR